MEGVQLTLMNAVLKSVVKVGVQEIHLLLVSIHLVVSGALHVLKDTLVMDSFAKI